MASLELTQVYLEKEQKQALQQRARAKGSKLAEEIRHAVDAYLAGVTAEDLEPLDAATREAKKHLDAMVVELDRINRKLDAAFAEMERIRGSRPSAKTRDAS